MAEQKATWLTHAAAELGLSTAAVVAIGKANRDALAARGVQLDAEFMKGGSAAGVPPLLLQALRAPAKEMKRYVAESVSAKLSGGSPPESPGPAGASRPPPRLAPDAYARLSEERLSHFVEQAGLSDHDAERLRDLLKRTISDSLDASDAIAQRTEFYQDAERRQAVLNREYRQEVEFARIHHEHIRAERATFFAETLPQIAAGLNASGLPKAECETLLRAIVAAQLASLDASAGLAHAAAPIPSVV